MAFNHLCTWYCKVPANVLILFCYKDKINQKKKMETQKKLFRIKDTREVLGGVAQGLANYFNTDVKLFRVLFVLLFFTPFPSVICYVILWIALPKSEAWNLAYIDGNQSVNSNFNTNMSNQRNGGLIGGITLIILGVIFAFREYADINLFHYIGKAWPLFFIGMGLWLIFKDGKNNNNSNTF